MSSPRRLALNFSMVVSFSMIVLLSVAWAQRPALQPRAQLVGRRLELRVRAPSRDGDTFGGDRLVQFVLPDIGSSDFYVSCRARPQDAHAMPTRAPTPAR